MILPPAQSWRGRRRRRMKRRTIKTQIYILKESHCSFTVTHTAADPNQTTWVSNMNREGMFPSACQLLVSIKSALASTFILSTISFLESRRRTLTQNRRCRIGLQPPLSFWGCRLDVIGLTGPESERDGEHRAGAGRSDRRRESNYLTPSL